MNEEQDIITKMDKEFDFNLIIKYFKKHNINIMEPISTKELQFRPEATKELYKKKIFIIYVAKYNYFPRLIRFDNKDYAEIEYNININSVSNYINNSVLKNIHLAIDDNKYEDFNKYALSNDYNKQYNNYLTQNNKLPNKLSIKNNKSPNKSSNENNKLPIKNNVLPIKNNKLPIKNNKSPNKSPNKLSKKNNNDILIELKNNKNILNELKNKILKIENENKNTIKNLNIKIKNNENEIIVLKNDIIILKKQNNYLKNTIELNIFLKFHINL